MSSSVSAISRSITGLSGAKPASRMRWAATSRPSHHANTDAKRSTCAKSRPERLADVAHGAARPVGDERGRQRCPVAAIFLVDVLHHFLAPLVLEVDVDVGRLVALAADEAFEQHAHPRRIDFGDPERVADGRVRRGAAALAEDLFLARECDDVVDGEEIGLVAKLGDEGELVLDQLADVGRHAGREAPREPRLGQLAQVRGRRLARRHDFLRVLVAQLVEREATALRDRDGLGEQRRRIDRREPRPRAQVPLAVGEEREAAVGDRLLEPDRGDRVLQRAPRADVHVDIARGNLGQPARLRELRATCEPGAIAGTSEELDCDPRALRERGGDPMCGRERVGIGRVALARRDLGRHPQREQARGERGDVVALERVGALLRLPPPARDELRQVAVARAIGREQHDLDAVAERELAADHQWQAGVLGREMRADGARDRAFVGDGERRVTERLRALDQLFGMRRATQKRKVRKAVQLGVGGEHGATIATV